MDWSLLTNQLALHTQWVNCSASPTSIHQFRIILGQRNFRRATSNLSIHLEKRAHGHFACEPLLGHQWSNLLEIDIWQTPQTLTLVCFQYTLSGSDWSSIYRHLPLRRVQETHGNHAWSSQWSFKNYADQLRQVTQPVFNYGGVSPEKASCFKFEKNIYICSIVLYSQMTLIILSAVPPIESTWLSEI